MVSPSGVASDHEFLLQPQDVGRQYGRPHVRDYFEDFDASGFDECFPTVFACQYPLDHDVSLPDHGELRAASWEVWKQDDRVIMEASSRALRCRFRKSVQLEGDELSIEYELTNESDQRVCYLWSAHPLLRVEPGSRSPCLRKSIACGSIVRETIVWAITGIGIHGLVSTEWGRVRTSASFAHRLSTEPSPSYLQSA
jgi:hypothetical protein